MPSRVTHPLAELLLALIVGDPLTPEQRLALGAFVLRALRAGVRW